MLPRDVQDKFLSAQDTNEVDWAAHIEVLPLATWISNPNGDNVYINQAYRSLLGVVNDEHVLRQRWSNHIHPADRDRYLKSWRNFVTGSSARFQESVRWKRPDTGQIVELAVRAQKLTCGQCQGWVRTSAAERALSKLEELAYVRIK